MFRYNPTLSLLLIAGLATAGCEEAPAPVFGADAGAGAQPGPGGPMGPGGGPGAGPVGSPPAGVPDDPSLQLRRLTRGELVRSLENVLGPIELIDAEPDLHHAGFARVGARQVTTSSSGVERLSFAFEDALDQVFGDPVAVGGMVSCDVAAAGCVEQSIAELGQRAWRRPLDADEIDARRALAVGCGEGLPGLRCVVASLLYSPNFLYRIEVPTDGVYIGYAMASRLSYFLWGGPPDDALLAAAAAGELDTAEGVRQHAARMMEDPRARTGLRSFVDEWFRTDRLERLGRDILAVTFEPLQFELGRSGTLQPWLEQMVYAAGEELRRMVEHHVFERDADYLDLLTTDTTVVDANLLDIYQLGFEEGFPVQIGSFDEGGEDDEDDEGDEEGEEGEGDDLNACIAECSDACVNEDNEDPEDCAIWCRDDCNEEGQPVDPAECRADCQEWCAEDGLPNCDQVCEDECSGEDEDEGEQPFDPAACNAECQEWCAEDGLPNCDAVCEDECSGADEDEEEGEGEGEGEGEEGEWAEGPLRVTRLQTQGEFDASGFAIARHTADSPRRGLMGTMAVLGQLGKQNETSPTRRGLYIMRRILCLEVGEPPDDIDQCHRPEGVSRRDSMENHHMCAQSCAGCHSQMDPIGFAMDDFDTIGRLRQVDDWGFPLNKAVDWRLVRPAGSEMLQFDSLRTMAETFRELPEATECVTRQVYRFATGRAEGVSDQATIGELTQLFRSDGRRLKPFLIAFTATDAFRRAAVVDLHAAPTLADIQAEIFGPECSACHVGSALGGFDLTADDQLMARLQGPSSAGMPYITPGEPDQSYLWHKVAATHADVGGAGGRMPPNAALSEHEMQRLRAWIEGL